MKPRAWAWVLLAFCGAGLLAPARPGPDRARGPLTRAYLDDGAPVPTRTPEETEPSNPAPRTPEPEIPTVVPEPETLEGLLIEIQNGSGAPKVALKLSVALDRRRIRTLRVYNADRWNYATTLIRHRPGFARRSRILAQLLGLGDESVSIAGKIAEDADMVVILGEDHDRVVRKASRRDEP